MKMNKETKRAVVLSALLISLVLLAVTLRHTLSEEDRRSVQVQEQIIDTTRQDIVFILGDDYKGNTFYTEAEHFYRYNEKYRAEHLVTHCRSLLEMRNYLEDHAPTNGLPWGRVEAVVHSNQWEGMSLSVVPEGPRTTTENLQIAMERSYVKPLPKKVLDSRSELLFYACGLGNNEALLDKLSACLSSEGETVPVYSPKQFVYFTSETYEDMPYNTQRYVADFWQTHYPSYYHPGDYVLARQLNQSYNEEGLAFSKALEREVPRFPGDSFHMEFKIPVVWYVTYEEDDMRPDLSEKDKELEWLYDQEDLVAKIHGLGFDLEDFRWTTRKARYTYDDGYEDPAIKAIGYCSIVTVLRPVVEEVGGEAFVPALNDSRYFGASKG